MTNTNYRREIGCRALAFRLVAVSQGIDNIVDIFREVVAERGGEGFQREFTDQFPLGAAATAAI
ncbi:hypothetical protein [Thalassotalea sediminis]|uniref:hypothetical protein n=1 Tax=Thalassotalea sediminis TaxID=1759089 RepID=UPI0025739201|nr:hypothetical protein [Thalassotalea sediminis]